MDADGARATLALPRDPVPAGVSHGFAATGAPALLEAIGEQGCGTSFAVRRPDGTLDWVEVHRPELPWDRPGEPTDIDALNERAVTPGRGTRSRQSPLAAGDDRAAQLAAATAGARSFAPASRGQPRP